MVLDRGLYQSEGKTPEQTLRSAIARLARTPGSRFVLLGDGYIDLTREARAAPDHALIDLVHRYASRSPGLAKANGPARSSPPPETSPIPMVPAPVPRERSPPAEAVRTTAMPSREESGAGRLPTVAPVGDEPAPRRTASAATGLSFADAAFSHLLARSEPMHYRRLAEAVLAAGTFESRGETPHQTLRSAIAREVAVRGPCSRFTLLSQGMVAISPFGRGREADPPHAPALLRAAPHSIPPGDEPEANLDPAAGVVEQVAGSPRFQGAYRALTRIKPPMDQVVAILTALVERSGRATRAGLGNATGTPMLRIAGLCVALQKILNQEDARVLAFDPESDTLSLDLELLRETFLPG